MEKELPGIYKSFLEFDLQQQSYHAHEKLNLTFNPEKPLKRVQNWKALLSEYDYELKHITGNKKNIADVLSRVYNIQENEGYPYCSSEISEWQSENGNKSNNVKIKKIITNAKD